MINVYSDRTIHLAKIVSGILNPLVLPLLVFGFAAYRLENEALQALWIITLGALFFTIIPWVILLGMKRKQLIRSIDVKERTSRNMPFVYGLFSMGCGLIAFQYAPIHNNMIYVVLCIISINNILIAAVINIRWKISVHAIGMGTACVVLYYLSGSLPLQWPIFSFSSFTTASILGISLVFVQFSRVILNFHTPSQVISGGIISIILTIVQLSLFLSKSLESTMV